MELDEVTTSATTSTQPPWGRRVLVISIALGSLVAFADDAVRAQPPSRGILLLAHGGSASWNAVVTALSQRLNERVPTEVAFGMASRPSMQAAVDRLTVRGVHEIVGVPLFISSHSSVIESTQYLLGVRRDAPADLATFARMRHGVDAASHAATPSADPASDEGTRPVSSTLPIRMVSALDDHPIVAEILASRAETISRDPRHEVVILVAHGPVSDQDNVLWLADMRRLADRIASSISFARVDVTTVRDDAPPPLRAAATAALRALVTRASTEKQRTLIVPLLLSYGGIEEGIRKRLDGLEYVMAPQALMPDDRVMQWVLESASVSARAQKPNIPEPRIR